MDIVKIFSFTAMPALVRMLAGLVSVKVVASIIGLADVALGGQLNNFATTALSINSGITKYVSEYKEDEDKVKDCLSTALRITVACSLVVGIALIWFNSYLSEYVMLSPDYGYVFIIFGFTILFYAF